MTRMVSAAKCTATQAWPVTVGSTRNSSAGNGRQGVDRMAECRGVWRGRLVEVWQRPQRLGDAGKARNG